MKGIDPAKVFIIAMSFVILGLAAAIVVTYSHVSAYESAFREAKDGLYKKLVMEVESCKAFAAMEQDSAKVDLENLASYITEKARICGIDPAALNHTPAKPKNDRRNHYTEYKYKVTFKTDVDREKFAKFLFNLENGSSILKVSSINLVLESGRRGSTTEEDMWRPQITVGYRKPLQS